MNQTVVEFCNKHDACDRGRRWAINTGCETMAEIWERKDLKHDWRVWVATREGVFTEKEMKVFACWCVRQIWDLLEDERSKRAIEVAERYIEGKVTDEEIKKAINEAKAAATWMARVAGAAATRAAAAAARAAEAATRVMEATWTVTETTGVTWWVVEARQGEEEKQGKYLIELGNPFNR